MVTNVSLLSLISTLIVNQESVLTRCMVNDDEEEEIGKTTYLTLTLNQKEGAHVRTYL